MHYLRQAGGKAAARSALLDARAWFEQALGVLEALPESQATLEQAFDIRLELRPVLRQLGEGRQMLEHLREAEALAERLKDDRRRGRVCAFMTTVQSSLDELDEALVTGTRALEIAERLGDLRLRIAHHELSRAGALLSGRVRTGGRVGHRQPRGAARRLGPRVFRYGRAGIGLRSRFLIMSLAELGQIRRGGQVRGGGDPDSPSRRSMRTPSVGPTSPRACSTSSRATGRRRAHGSSTWIAMLRTGNVAVHLPWAVASSAWALAQLGEASEALSRLREGEQLLERQAARGIVGHRGWAYQRGGSRLSAARPARRGAAPGRPRGRILRGASRASRPMRCTCSATSRPIPTGSMPRRGEAHYREALALAEPRGMRPLVAHCHLGLGKLYRRTGKPERAHESLTTATTMYREMDMGFWLKQAEADMMSSGDVGPRARPAAEIRPVVEAP